MLEGLEVVMVRLLLGRSGGAGGSLSVGLRFAEKESDGLCGMLRRRETGSSAPWNAEMGRRTHILGWMSGQHVVIRGINFTTKCLLSKPNESMTLYIYT